MPQLANLVIADQAATPVNHTYTPAGIQGNVAVLVESTGVPVGDNKATIGWSTTQSGRRKSSYKLVLPVVATQTINGVSTPVVVRVAYVSVEFAFDQTSTEQERKDAVALIRNGLVPTNPVVYDTIVKCQGVY